MQQGIQQQYSVKLKDLAEEHGLEVIFASSDYESVEIVSYNVQRPSLQLAGFYDYFDKDRLRLWGKSESAFLSTLPEGRRREVVETLLSHKIPAMIFCNQVQPDELLLSAAKKYDVPALATEVDTSELIARLSDTLRSELSPRLTVHGVLIQVYGEGMLITGESGIGKSEIALELINRGHRLVADDAVEIRRVSRDTLRGTAPKMIRYLMELRGVGLIDVRRIFGVGAVFPSGRLDLVADLQHWREDVEYDRLGLEEEYTEYLGVTLPKITIPVAPGRNLATVLEVAAMNHRQRRIGYNTAKEFLKRYDGSIDSGEGESAFMDDFGK